MKTENYHELLACKINEIFQKGLHINKDIWHYIESTFSASSFKLLNEILTDNENCEQEPLIELIFFPDESIQIQLEDFLENPSISNIDHEKILNHLFINPCQVLLNSPDQIEKIKFSAPRWAVSQFIARLNISKKIDQRILEAINTHIDKSLRPTLKVRLRNSRFVQTEKKVFFFCNFFKQIQASSEQILKMFNFILNFFDEIQDDKTIFTALMDKKKFYFRNLQQAIKFEKQLQKNNMEILLLQGVRNPHICKNDVKEKMTIIDQISYAVFGRSEQIEALHTNIDMGTHDNSDINKIIQALT